MHDAIVEIEGLRKKFRSVRGTRVALDGLDMEVRSGGVHGFLGPNGSGKTTTLRALLGLARAVSRSVAAFRGSGAGTAPGSVIVRRSSPAFRSRAAQRCSARLLAGVLLHAVTFLRRDVV